MRLPVTPQYRLAVARKFHWRLFATFSTPPQPFALTLRPARAGSFGFSLTEVAMAIGIIAFAFISLIALIPTSLQTFRRAMDTTVTSQIAQRLIAEAQETDFDFLVDNTRNGAVAQNTEFSRLPLRYFDDQGNELKDTDKQAAQYWGIIRISQPGNRNPSVHDPNWFASLPETRAPFNPRDMTIVTVELAVNPNARQLPFDAATLLLDPIAAAKSYLTYQSYSAVVARNGYLTKK